jgi:hypothetical protein
MRDLLRAIDDDPGSTDHDNRGMFLPHAPRLAGGIAELAYLTVEAMRRGGGLSRSQFKRILATVSKGQFLQSAGIGNDVSGIKRLLALQRRQDLNVVEHIDELSGERIFRLSSGEWNPLARTPVLHNGEKSGVDLDYSDRGLTFGEKTLISIGGKIWLIDRIRTNAITIDTPPGNKKVPLYTFVNAYRFTSDIAPILESAQPGSDFGKAVLHASFTRTTEQIYDYPGGAPPFSGGKTLNPRLAGQDWVKVDRNLKCVAHLVLTGLSRVLPVGGSPPGYPPLSDELSKAAVALAVCTVIKDTIVSLFPEAAPRISVLSNQLGPLRPQLARWSETSKAQISPEQLALTLFLAGRVGYLVAPESGMLDAWPSEFREGLADRQDILEIFVVEDADWDLGVARAVLENDDILRAAARFADAIVSDEEAEGEGSYLRFGASAVPSFVYLRGAHSVLSRLARVGSPPEPEPPAEASL